MGSGSSSPRLKYSASGLEVSASQRPGDSNIQSPGDPETPTFSLQVLNCVGFEGQLTGQVDR